MIRQATLLACLAPVTFAAPALAAPAFTGETAVVWEFENFESSLKNAAAADKPVLIYFWSNGSESCARMYSDTMSNAAVIAEMQKYACFSADTASTVGYELFQKYNMTSVPAVIFVTHEGAVNDAVIGSIDAGGFVEELNRVQEGRDTIAAFRERAAAAPDDFEVQFAYAVKLQDCGDKPGYEEVTGRIMEADPKGKHVVAARLHMQEIQQAIIDAAPQEEGQYDFEAADLTQLTRFVNKLEHDEVAFEGWNWIAAIEKEREDNAAYRKAVMTAWPHISEEKVRPFSYDVASSFWEERDELDRKEKKFVMTVTIQAAEATEKFLEEREAEMIAAGGEGCASYEGCSDGEGCGGCGGGKAELVLYRASTADALARALYLNGKKKDALAEAERAAQLAPENEEFVERVAYIQNGK